MRVVVATGLYPPQVGGPALYAQGVKEVFEKMGHETTLVLFSKFRRFPTGVRHFLYTLKLFAAAWRADAIFAFDTYSVGVPSAFVGSLLGIPVVLRIGGDFLWESYVERTKAIVPLSEFYRTPRDLRIKEHIAFHCVRWMLHHVTLAFNTRWLFEIWKEPYQLTEENCHIVENVIGERLGALPAAPVIALYGRRMTLKNAEAFKEALEKARGVGVDLSLEEGIVPQEKLLERLRQVYAVAVPSFSDVAPNSVIDAIRCGKPFLLTKHSGYARRFGEYGVLVDPANIDDMVRGIKELADPKVYEQLSKRIAAFKEVRTYADIAREYLALIPKS